MMRELSSAIGRSFFALAVFRFTWFASDRDGTDGAVLVITNNGETHFDVDAVT